MRVAGYPSFRLRYLIAACIPRLRLNKVGYHGAVVNRPRHPSWKCGKFCAKLDMCKECHQSLLQRSPLLVLFRDGIPSPAVTRACREPCAGRRRGDVPDPCLTELRITTLACETLTANCDGWRDMGTNLHLYVWVCLSVCLPVGRSVGLSVCLSVCLSSVCLLSVHLSVRPSVRLSVCLSVVCMYVCVCVCVSIHMFLFSCVCA